jgi:fatty acid synthase
MAPLGGLFNTAVVYEDALFNDMKEDMFQRVMEPKLFATLHFDELTRDKCPELDYFVTFSSISCGRGNGGQTNYNYANAAMDSVCEQRFASGLPGLSIQWGVVGDVGIVTEKTGSTEVTLLGATSQRLHSLLESLDRFLQTKCPVCLSYVKAEKAGNSSGENVDLLRMVSRIFGIKDISALDPFASLGSLGIDSLIAVEMKQLLERATGSSMTVKEIRDVTIATLIELSKSLAAAKTE